MYACAYQRLILASLLVSTAGVADAATHAPIVKFDELAERLASTTWQRRACGIGSKGFRVYHRTRIDFAEPINNT